MEQQGKVCTKCGVWKPLEEFNKCKRHKDGRVSECKECKRKYDKERREQKNKGVKESKAEKMLEETINTVNEIIKKCDAEGVVEFVNTFKKKGNTCITMKHIPTSVEDVCYKDKKQIENKINGLIKALTDEKINKIIEEAGMKGEIIIDGTFKKEGRQSYIWLKHIPTGRRENCQRGEKVIKQKIKVFKSGWCVEKLSIEEINSIDENIVYDGEFREEGKTYVWLKHKLTEERWSCEKRRRAIQGKINKIKKMIRIITKNGIKGKECTCCGQWNPLSEFRDRKEGQHGKESICKTCLSEKAKEYRFRNIDRISEYDSIRHKEKYLKNKDINLKEISEMLIKTKPFLKGLDAFGIIYKVTNVKTNRVYIGQTVTSLNVRYGANLIQGWVQDRLKKSNQKFKEELVNENDFIIDKIDVGVCQYHLNKLEAHYINKYDSFYNGYNNNGGKHIDEEGIEEFNEILEKYNLEFIDNELRRK